MLWIEWKSWNSWIFLFVRLFSVFRVTGFFFGTFNQADSRLQASTMLGMGMDFKEVTRRLHEFWRVSA
jgi:hypothetical protein